MYDDEGNVYTYDRSHRFEDGDKPGRLRARARQSQDELDLANERPSSAVEIGDDRSLHRSKSRSSLRSFGRRSAPEQDMLPGAAEAERRKVKGKTRGLHMLGSRKGKADRHARSERVMHDTDYDVHRNPYDDASIDSLDGANGAVGGGLGRRDSFDGPENADDTVGKRYARGAAVNGSHATGYDAKALPNKPQQTEAVVDIMNDNHQF